MRIPFGFFTLVLLLSVVRAQAESKPPFSISVLYPTGPGVVSRLQSGITLDQIDSGARFDSDTLVFALLDFKQQLERSVGQNTIAFFNGPMGAGQIDIAFQSSLQTFSGICRMSVQAVAPYRQTASFRDQAYCIDRIGNQIIVVANTAVGLMYGAYGLLDLLGYTFWSSLSTNDVVPAVTAASFLALPHPFLKFPRARFRGFLGAEFDGSDPVKSRLFFRWMARNALNFVDDSRIAGASDAIRSAKRLGVYIGHFTHSMIGDLLCQSSGSAPPVSLDWYGQYRKVGADGNVTYEPRVIPCNSGDRYFNPSFANPDLANYLAGQIVTQLQNNLSYVDLLGVWPSDTIGEWDQSELAVKTGNPTDNLLSFYSTLLAQIAAAGLPVTLAGISYQETWAYPSRRLSTPFLDANHYIHVFYPLERAYNDRLMLSKTAPDRNAINVTFTQMMDGWHNHFYMGATGINEYYRLASYVGLAHAHLPYLVKEVVEEANANPEFFSIMNHTEAPGPLTFILFAMSRALWVSPGETPASIEQLDQSLRLRYFGSRYPTKGDTWRQTVWANVTSAVTGARQHFGINSLEMSILQQLYWLPTTLPFPNLNELGYYMSRFFTGGIQGLRKFVTYIPEAPSCDATSMACELNQFAGLTSALSILETAKPQWTSIVGDTSLSAGERATLCADAKFFASTYYRYQLLKVAYDAYQSSYPYPSAAFNLLDGVGQTALAQAIQRERKLGLSYPDAVYKRYARFLYYLAKGTTLSPSAVDRDAFVEGLAPMSGIDVTDAYPAVCGK